MAEGLFEFCIPTEQLVIYSVMIGKRRETFHGVLQLKYRFNCKIRRAKKATLKLVLDP
jgi:hypothetical protein|eukprot:gene16657-11917_t